MRCMCARNENPWMFYLSNKSNPCQSTLRLRPKFGLPMATAPMHSTVCSSTTPSPMHAVPQLTPGPHPICALPLCLILSLAPSSPLFHHPFSHLDLPVIWCHASLFPSFVWRSLILSMFLKVIEMSRPVVQKKFVKSFFWPPMTLIHAENFMVTWCALAIFMRGSHYHWWKTQKMIHAKMRRWCDDNFLGL